jgi:protein-S-isoprenylcysteine O-methyltransferase Ste14
MVAVVRGLHVYNWLRNIPLPQSHLVALGVGIGLGVLTRWAFPLPPWLRLVGLVAVAAGLGLITWATWASAPTHLADPTRLVTTGPYALSRNPMYVGWTLAYAGLTAASANAWMALFLPVVLVATDLTIRHEERQLRARFGSAYTAYAAAVRRYL